MQELLFEIPRATVSWSSGGKEFGFQVRGLSDEDLVVLVRDHQESIEKAFAMVQGLQGEGADLAQADVTAFGTALLDVVPELVAQMIALAADASDRAPDIRRMPAPIKLRAINEVWNLTVVDTGGLQSFLDQTLSLLRGVTKGMATAKDQLRTAEIRDLMDGVPGT